MKHRSLMNAVEQLHLRSQMLEEVTPAQSPANASARRRRRRWELVAMTMALLLAFAAWNQVRAAREDAATALLATSVEMGDVAQMREALSLGADPNAGTGGRIEYRGLRGLIDTLLRRKPRYEGDSLLSRAVAHPAALATLLEAGADPNPRFDDQPPLAAAAANGDMQAVAILLRHSAHVNARASDGSTAIQAALSSGNIPMARLLVRAGADLRSNTRDGTTTLMLAAHAGDVKTIDDCLKKGLKPDDRNNDGLTALHYAAFSASRPAAEVLVRAGASIDAKDKYGTTPLMNACIRHTPEMAIHLLRLGASATVRDLQGRQAHHWAAWPGQMRGKKLITILESLRRAGADLTAPNSRYGNVLLMAAKRSGNAQAISWLVKQGLSFRQRDPFGRTAMQYTSLTGDAEEIRLLKGLGLQVDDPDSSGNTPLHLAVRAGNLVAVRALLAAGARVGARNLHGDSVGTLAHSPGRYHNAEIAALIDRAAASRRTLQKSR